MLFCSYGLFTLSFDLLVWNYLFVLLLGPGYPLLIENFPLILQLSSSLVSSSQSLIPGCIAWEPTGQACPRTSRLQKQVGQLPFLLFFLFLLTFSWPDLWQKIGCGLSLCEPIPKKLNRAQLNMLPSFLLWSH